MYAVGRALGIQQGGDCVEATWRPWIGRMHSILPDRILGTASVVGCRPSDFVSVMEIGTGGATKAEEKSRWKVFGRFLRAMSRLQIRGGLLVGRVSPLLFTALRLRQAQGQRLDISEPVLQ